jgi:hypothetical protein
MSPYCAMGNNPVSYADPNGDIFFIIPQIGASGKGGLSIGLEIGIGIPGVLSASITGGVNLGSKTSVYWSVQGSAGGFYAGYGSSGGFAGWGYRYAGISGGVSYGAGGWGVGLSYGGTSGRLNGSLGIGWSQSGGFDWNVSGGYTYQYSPADSKSTNYNARGGVQSSEISSIIKKLVERYQMTPEQLREALAVLAESHWINASSDWAKGDGNYKCSKFVNDLIAELGMKHHNKLLSSNEWFTETSVLGWAKITDGSLKRVDLGVMNGHMGIMRNEKSLIYAGTAKIPDVIKSVPIADFKRVFVGWRYVGLLFILTQLNFYVQTNIECNHIDIKIIINNSKNDLELYKSLPYYIKLNEKESILTNDDHSFFEGKFDNQSFKNNVALNKLSNNYLLYEDQYNCYISNVDSIDNKFLFLSASKIIPNLNNIHLTRILESAYTRFENGEIHESILTLILNRYVITRALNFSESEILNKYLKLHNITIFNKLLIEKCLTFKND